MKVITIVGARPQFIKEGIVSKKIRENGIEEVIIHTGQHYDDNMSDIFFKELKIPIPDYNLGIGSGTHGKQTGEMLIEIEKILIKEKPSMVIVYGDTNSTLAGALAATKLYIPVAHIEAGPRDYADNPEEKNRKLTDHISNLLFCPTELGVDYLKREGINEGVHFVGDVMYDAAIYYYDVATEYKGFKDYINELNILTKNSKIENVSENEYYLCTIHREENTRCLEEIKEILEGLNRLDKAVLFPIHPRTYKLIINEIQNYKNIVFVEPVGYFAMLVFIRNAFKIITDSGGVMREAFFFKKQCITVNVPACFLELLENEWNIIVEQDQDEIVNAVIGEHKYVEPKNYFGNGNASGEIARIIKKYIQER